ncbi:MAG: HypC/HybG/HupF family hydrogenase formation chaperone [Acidimicrobiia bacterium]|nr:HypC/HybG/HupF family hydrogenase formation chaperone [Acidimicrobiia bacterium]
MCLSRLARIEAVDADGSRAVGVSEGRTVSLSLAVLTLAGEVIIPGDWVLVATGLAVRRLTDEEAAAIARARTELGSG